MKEIVIIGSGPAGISLAMSLRDQPVKITILDIGSEVEPGTRERIDRLQSSIRSQWSPRDSHDLFSFRAEKGNDVPKKQYFGSNYFNQVGRDAMPQRNIGTEGFPSSCRGGYSSIWGANILPFLGKDIATWPIGPDDLAHSYREVLKFVPLATHEPSLTELFPLHTETLQELQPSGQGRALYEHLQKHQEALKQRNIHFGYSRLAIETEGTHKDPCQYCGLCLIGCPFDIIYSSRWTLDQLIREERVDYIPDTLVTRIDENEDSVTITGKHVATQEPFQVECSRCFLGTGPYATSRILLESFPQIEELTLKDSQYFLLPFFRYRGSPDPIDERLHALCQVNVDLFDETLSSSCIHLQFYSYNAFIYQRLQQLFRWMPGFLRRSPIDYLTSHLLSIQGYFHSDLSHQMRMTRDGETLVVEKVENPETEVVFGKLVRKIRGLHRYLGGMPMAPWALQGPPGLGYHVGGSVPMSDDPSPAESDLYGRPFGLQRTHLIDASTFPSIPATTITLTIMANAYRIGQQLASYHDVDGS